MTVTSQDTETVRRFYAALAALIWALQKPALLPMRPGTCRARVPSLATTMAGPLSAMTFSPKLGPLSGHTFRAELIDVAVGQDFIVAVQHATAAYQGRHLDITGCQLMRVEEGRIAEVRGHYSDQHGLDAFWKTE